MTAKYPKIDTNPRRNTAPRPSAQQAGPGSAPRPAPAAKPAAQAPVKAKKKGWPIIELVLFLLVVKIAAGAYYILWSPKEAQAPQSAVSVADSASLAVARAVTPETDAAAGSPPATEPRPASMVDGYLAAAAEAVSPAVAQAAPIIVVPASSVSAVSAGAFMVLGQSASPEAAAQSAATIPLPPGGDDLLTPSAQLPPPPQAAPAAANSRDVAPLPPDPTTGAAQGIKAREQELARKEAMLATKEEALSSLESELNRQLAATEASRGEMEAMVKRNEAILTEMKALREQQKTEDEQQKDARIEHLVIAYKGMKPEQAGNLVNSLDDDVAVSILSAMPGRNAGLILAYVNPDKAARLTKAISEKRIDPNLLLADQPEPNL